jgi:hypothetical protein
MIVDSNLLIVEYVVQKEQVVLSHKRDRVHKTSRVQKSLKIVVLLISLDLFFKLINIEIALSMPLLLFKLGHSRNCVFPGKASIQIVLSCLKRSIVDYGKNVGVVACGVYQLLPQGFVLIFCEKQIVDRVE